MFNPTFLLLLALATSASPVKRANNQLIVSSRDQKCLSPAGGAAAVAAKQVGNGTPLVTMDCSQAAGWDISPGSGSVILTGTNFAMDAGTTPGNNGLLKVSDCASRVMRLLTMKTWQSYPGLSAQTWYLTADGRIAITGGNQCLDEGNNGTSLYLLPLVPMFSFLLAPRLGISLIIAIAKTRIWTSRLFSQNGLLTARPSDLPVHDWQHQPRSVFPLKVRRHSHPAWSIRNKSGPTPSSSSSSSSASPSPSTTPPPQNGVLPNVPRGNVYTDPSGGGKRIHPFNRDDLCLTVQGGSAFSGALVEV